MSTTTSTTTTTTTRDRGDRYGPIEWAKQTGRGKRQCNESVRNDRSFSTAGPRLWNSLPEDVQSSSTLTIFRRNHIYFVIVRCGIIATMKFEVCFRPRHTVTLATCFLAAEFRRRSVGPSVRSLSSPTTGHCGACVPLWRLGSHTGSTSLHSSSGG